VGTPAAAAVAAATAVRHPLRLREFSTRFLSGPGLLSAMPAATLTLSTIEHVKGYPSAYSLATSQALSGLTGLRDLTLYCCVKEPVGRLSEGCLHAVAQLSLLTALRLSRTAEDAELLLLPQQLQILELSTCCGKQPLQLQHLTGTETAVR
jgi:hypothetical protein